jgi:hypothetical protein
VLVLTPAAAALKVDPERVGRDAPQHRRLVADYVRVFGFAEEDWRCVAS